ncbi:uncharacterized protein [Musca autumnalis]|uniref:uncharacterized protein n=1 Tax=Musca autumnalis TaxID=221902 RepID=UPI003CFA4A53
MVISEQYSSKISGQWFEDVSKTAAIWIPDRRSKKPSKEGKGNGYVWIQFHDVTVMSCYLTPSDSMDEFQLKLNEIEDETRNIDGNIVMAGDFNSRAVKWGSQETNTRGRKIMEMIARLGLVIANVVCVPTFRRPGCNGTIPDITMVSENIANRIVNWKVLEIYTASDHQYISYTLQPARGTTRQRRREGTRKWNAKRLDRTALIAEIDRQSQQLLSEESASELVEKTMAKIIKGCNTSMPKLKDMGPGKEPVYWWNNQVADLRRDCLKRRRKYTRAKRRGPAITEHAEYKQAKKTLQLAIQESKKRKWEELRDDVNQDPFGLGYKIVMKKLRAQTPVNEMDDKAMDNIVNTLFPAHEMRRESPIREPITTPTMFTADELKTAARKLKKQ